MRIKLSFSTEKNLVMPVQYNYFIQSMIYRNISPALADFLHDHGYILNGRQFKLFTFSRMEGRFIMRKDKKIEFMSPVRLTVASAVERFLRELAEGMLRNDNLNLYGQKLMLESVEVSQPLEDEDFEEEITIKMLSPVVAYNTVERAERARTYYFSPWDEWFSELITANLEKKYELIMGKKYTGDYVRIIPIGPKDEKYCKVLDYKNTVIKGWMGIYKVKGDKRLLKIAYDTGLGSKNPQGFGCFEIIDGIKNMPRKRWL
ncbi:MAG: CRISPR-associated endoribonuclease Cas6 [Tepidanaerobacteraceae bacterium]|nr:CRISPR-associated endoribonuclease Cas6 [Tepidanaerobacteraceae bacterium]